MDRKLVGWARTVKARGGHSGRLPVLWLFTDAERLRDPTDAINRLPAREGGVVLRGTEGMAPVQIRRVARLCRARRLSLAVADRRWAARLNAGLHLSRGERGAGGRPLFVTSSAHGEAEIFRAQRAGARLIFLSPVFTTASHPGAAALGVLRWSALARHDRRIGALGGLNGKTLLRLPRWCRCIGAIGALGVSRLR